MTLVGCASVPVNYGKPKVGSKIGVMLLIDETPTYQHIGTTIFSNENSLFGYTDFKDKFKATLDEIAKNETSLNPMDFRFFAQIPLPEVNIPNEPKDIQAEQVDIAADKALNNFMTKFTEMLRTSEFI